MLIRLALRNIFRQRTRALLTLATIWLGVVSLILAAGFIDDILFQLREATIHSQLGHFQVFAPGFLESGNADPLAHVIEQSDKVTGTLRAIPGVAAVAPRLSFSGLLSNGPARLAVVAEGVDPRAEAALGTSLSMIQGEPLASASASSVVIGAGVADTLKLSVHDVVTLVVSTREGAMNVADLTVAGIFRSPFKDFDARAVRMKLPAARELLDSDAVNSIAVLLTPSASVDDALARTRAALPAGRYDVEPWWNLAEFYEAAVALYKRQFLVLEIIIGVMVLLSVANSINMSLHERQAEFGTVRALGYRPRAVFRQIVLEATLLGLIGSAAGIVLGAALAWVLSAIGIDMPPPPNSELGYTAVIRLSFENCALAACIGVAASIVGALLPALRLTRMQIVDALRQAV